MVILSVWFAFRVDRGHSGYVNNSVPRVDSGSVNSGYDPVAHSPIAADADQVRGKLILAGTPLGNLGDASDRLRQTLAAADLIAAEDTRRFRRLTHELNIPTVARIVSFYEGVEQTRIPQLVAAIQAGSDVVLVTDAGMPSVSDPGYRLVQACAAAEQLVTVVPGPSAVLAALAVSGLPSDRFCFEGFLARKKGERHSQLTKLATEPRTMVFFESPRRIARTLADMAEVLGADRNAVVCRELTKTYEETKRGKLGQLATWAQAGLLGEITVVVQGFSGSPAAVTPTELADQVAQLVADGIDRKQALTTVAKAAAVPKRVVYDAVLAAKNLNP